MGLEVSERQLYVRMLAEKIEAENDAAERLHERLRQR
jgi:hypothetical protein